MCLISVCPKGTSKNSEQVHKFITRGAETNRCGSGIMWKLNGEELVNIKKGFFNIQELHDFVTNLNLGLEDELVIHHRTRTQGETNEENTHPFIISDNHEICVALEGKFNLPMLAHNGMFSGLNRYEKSGYSDTYAFVNGIMSRKLITELLVEDTKLFRELVDKYWGWSKIAVLHPTYDVIMVGDFVKAEDELIAGAFYYHSNGGYKSYLEDRGGSSFEFPVQGEWGRRTQYTKQNKTTTTTSTSDNIDTSISCVTSKRKLMNTHLDGEDLLLTKENYGDFVFLLKPGCLLAGYDSTEAYVMIEFGYHTCRVASPQSPNVHQWVRMHDLNTLFYFIPKRDKEEMYKDYLILVNTFQVTKSGISKLRKQYNNKYKMRSDSKYIVKKLGIPIMKASINMFLDKVESEIASDLSREANEVSISD